MSRVPVQPTTIIEMASRIEMPEAIEPALALLAGMDGDAARDASVCIEFIARLDVDPRRLADAAARRARDHLETICRTLDPDYWGNYESCKRAAWIDSPAAPPGPVLGASAPQPCSPSSAIVRWPVYAAPHDHVLMLAAAEIDVMTLMERVIIEGRGWGLADRKKGHHFSIPLIPAKISRRGKKASVSAIEKAIPCLCRLGLLAYVGCGEKHRKLWTPTWDPRICDSPHAVFERAASLAERGARNTSYWRSGCGHRAIDPVRHVNEGIVAAIEAYRRSTFADQADVDCDRNGDL